MWWRSLSVCVFVCVCVCTGCSSTVRLCVNVSTCNWWCEFVFSLILLLLHCGQSHKKRKYYFNVASPFYFWTFPLILFDPMDNCAFVHRFKRIKLLKWDWRNDLNASPIETINLVVCVSESAQTAGKLAVLLPCFHSCVVRHHCF